MASELQGETRALVVGQREDPCGPTQDVRMDVAAFQTAPFLRCCISVIIFCVLQAY